MTLQRIRFKNGRILSIIKHITIILLESLMNLVLLLSLEKGSLIYLCGTKIDRKELRFSYDRII